MRAVRTLQYIAALLLVSILGCEGVIGESGGSPERDDVLKDPLDNVPVANARRLTREELDLTLGALLNTHRRFASELLPEDNQEREGFFLHWAFDNRYTHQAAEKVLVQAYETLAREASLDLVADEARRAALLPCEPSGPADESCFADFLRSFGRRAYRRPLTTDEVMRMMPLLDEATEENDFFAAVDLALRAFLQSPDFLYRIELGVELEDRPGVRELSGHEIATRMAYFLWGTGPDEMLLDLAESGTLSSSDDRRNIAALMLEEPAAIDQVERFHAQWLGFRQLPHSPELSISMRRETRALLERTIFENDAPYMDVFRATDTYLDERLADHYGMPAPTGEASFVPYEDPTRAGILAHGAVLGAFHTGGDTSTTRRGVFVRERLMCQVIPPPPPTVNVDDLPETHCKSELIEVHQQGACGGCHRLMDPVGWGLENFDLAGRFREHDSDKPECAIDGMGELDGTPFRGPRELSDILIGSGELEACTVLQVLRFALGREERPGDAEFLEELNEGRSGTNWTFRELLIDIVANERFAYVRDDEVEGE
ncbi:MAG: DUF1592 domain-containing protein [Myxococcota bacterium]